MRSRKRANVGWILVAVALIAACLKEARDYRKLATTPVIEFKAHGP